MSDDELNFSPAFSFGPRREGPHEAAAADGAPEVAPEPRFGAKELTLLPLGRTESAKSTAAPRRSMFSLSGWGAMQLAAPLALCAALGGGALLATHRESAADVQTADTATDMLKKMSARLDALEGKLQPEGVSDKKLAADVKSTLAATRDLNGALAQLGARVDRLDQAQSAKIEKLSERLDKDIVRSLSDATTHSEKRASLDVTPAQPVANTLPPARPPSPLAAARSNEPRSNAPSVSNEPTGSIERLRPVLVGYSVLDVRDGVALLQTRDGPQEVSPGDYLPGVGRVERIEKHGKQWAVVTSLGVIANE